MRTSPPAVIVITGIMASGKSTVAQLIAERLERSTHVRGDAFRRMLVAGREEFLPNPTPEAVRQLWLRYRLAAQVADGYAAAGFTTVLQDIAVGMNLPGFLGLIRTRPRYLVVLCPRAAVVAARESLRRKTGYGPWTVGALDESLRRDTPRLGLWVDNSEQAPAETAEFILASLPAALIDQLPGQESPTAC